MAIAFDAAVAFDSPTYSFDGVAVGPVTSGGYVPAGSDRKVAYVKKKRKPKAKPVLVFENTDLIFPNIELRTDEETALLLLLS